MRDRLFKVLFTFCFTIIAGCNSSDFYYLEFKNVNDGWEKNESLKFNFLPKKSKSNLKILIRNDKAYPFSNIYLISKIRFEKQLLIDTLNINFEDNDIDIFKTNSLSVKNYSFILKDNINFGQDSVSVELIHAIRPNNSSTAIQNLKGIISVGLLAE